MIQKKNHGTWFHVRSIGIAALIALAMFFTACNNPALSDDVPAARSVTAGTATFADVTITGTINTSLNYLVAIGLDENDAFDVGVWDVTSWFTNIPTGLSAQIVYALNESAIIRIIGTPLAVSSLYIRCTIPGSALMSGTPITVDINPNAAYNILWPYSSWTNSQALTSGSVNAAAYGNNLFVVGNRNDNSAAYSNGNVPSGWSPIPNGIFPNVNAHVSSIIFVEDNRTFYAVGDSGTMSYSTNGKDWYLIGTGLLNNSDIRGIAYGNGITVIVGTGGQAQYKTGYPAYTGWTSISGISTSGNYNSVVFGQLLGTASMFVLTGQNAVSGYSMNGINWTPTTSQTAAIFSGSEPSQASIKQVAFDIVHSKFVIVGYHKAAYATGSGAGGLTNWVGVELSDIMEISDKSSWLNAVTYANGYFVAGGSLGKSIASTDGFNWAITGAQGQFPGTTSFVNAITYGNGKYLIGGGPDNGPGVGVYNN